MTRQEPALCTSAPTVGVKSPKTESVTATKLMHIESVMVHLIVLTVAFASFLRYGIFETLPFIIAMSAASRVMLLTLLIFGATVF